MADGRVMPRECLRPIGDHLDEVSPERKDEFVAAIRTRAEELVDANQDMVVDEPSNWTLALVPSRL